MQCSFSLNNVFNFTCFPVKGALVGEDRMAEILGEIQQALPTLSQQTRLLAPQLDRCVVFVCDVAHNLFSSIQVGILVSFSCINLY